MRRNPRRWPCIFDRLDKGRQATVPPQIMFGVETIQVIPMLAAKLLLDRSQHVPIGVLVSLSDEEGFPNLPRFDQLQSRYRSLPATIHRAPVAKENPSWTKPSPA
jgi:hypothetical protein